MRNSDINGFKSKKSMRHQQQTLHRKNDRTASLYLNNQFNGKGNANSSYDMIVPYELLTIERLSKEPVIIQKLFQALAIIRSRRLSAQRGYQTIQNELLNIRMECDRKVREFQKAAQKQLLSLQAEFSRLKNIYDKETSQL